MPWGALLVLAIGVYSSQASRPATHARMSSLKAKRLGSLKCAHSNVLAMNESCPTRTRRYQRVLVLVPVAQGQLLRHFRIVGELNIQACVHI